MDVIEERTDRLEKNVVAVTFYEKIITLQHMLTDVRTEANGHQPILPA